MMTIRMALLFPLMLLLTGCGHESNRGQQWMKAAIQAGQLAKQRAVRLIDDNKPPPRKVMRGAVPELIVAGDHITFNGRPLVLRASPEEWIQVLGPPSRIIKDDDGNFANYIWDEVGISSAVLFAFSRAPREEEWMPFEDKWGRMRHHAPSVPESWQVKSLNVALKASPDSPSEIEPRGAFPGYLEVHGVGIDAHSTLRELQWWSERSTFSFRYYCRLSRWHDGGECRYSMERGADGKLRPYNLIEDNARKVHPPRWDFSFVVHSFDERQIVAFHLE